MHLTEEGQQGQSKQGVCGHQGRPHPTGLTLTVTFPKRQKGAKFWANPYRWAFRVDKWLLYSTSCDLPWSQDGDNEKWTNSPQQAPVPHGHQYQGLLIHLTEMPWCLTRATSRKNLSINEANTDSNSNLKPEHWETMHSTIINSWTHVVFVFKMILYLGQAMFGASVSTFIKWGYWAQCPHTSLPEVNFFCILQFFIVLQFLKSPFLLISKGLSACSKPELIEYKRELGNSASSNYFQSKKLRSFFPYQKH